MSVRRLGIETKRLAEVRHGSVQLPACHQDEPDVVVGAGVLRLRPDRLAIMRERFVEPPLLLAYQAEAVAGSRRLRFDAERSIIFADGVVESARDSKREAQVQVRRGR